MVRVTVKRENNRITQVEIKGHAGYAEHGKDIVCSAISSIASTALLGLINVSSQKVVYTKNEEKGYLMFAVPKAKNYEEQLQQDAITETMVLGLRDIEIGYKSFINLKEEVV